ncbi:unnamed protein product [Paramecium sonneborni]|uniref:Transmembrane protein n=1 Tax=Paramecium sonneborni TaxID=65129 RepID=A0A8S1Q7Y1_9CILI|nr:unnamed protein product [Paramecium sonneborni]
MLYHQGLKIKMNSQKFFKIQQKRDQEHQQYVFKKIVDNQMIMIDQNIQLIIYQLIKIIIKIQKANLQLLVLILIIEVSVPVVLVDEELKFFSRIRNARFLARKKIQ